MIQLNDQQRQALLNGAAALGVTLSAAQHSALLDYLALLHKWNKAYNLTAVRDLDEMISRHLLDSLSLVTEAQNGGGRWLDVGSGGGMPGIPLAILFPEQDFVLLDANGKKTRFLTQVKLELKLHNLTVIHSRVEQFHVTQPFTDIVSRAFSAIADFTRWTRHLGDSQTRWLAMKGQYPEQELAALAADFQLQHTQTLTVPSCQGQRHLLILRRIL